MTIVDAIRRQDFATANKLVTQLLQQKVFEVFDAERHAVFSEGASTFSAPPKPENWDKGWTHPWRIGGGGKETPYLKNGKWKLYVWNVSTGKHAEYDFASDSFENED